MMKRCLAEGCPTLVSSGSRCAQHRTEQRAKYSGAWQSISQTAIREHVALLGWWCPGWKTDAHDSTDLTLDHYVGVLCRGCNSRKRNLGDG
jgi:hypothetical protein